MSEIDHERIWLEPKCCADPDGGRTWCEDNVFDDCEDGGKPTEYVRADRLTTLSQHNAKLVEAARFTHDELVRLQLARTLTTNGIGGAAKIVSAIVSKTRQALNEGVQP